MHVCIVGKMKRVFWFLVVSVVLAASIPLSHCSKKPVGIARKEDVPFIKCQVCEKLAKQLYQQVQNKQAEMAPKKVFFFLLLVHIFNCVSSQLLHWVCFQSFIVVGLD